MAINVLPSVPSNMDVFLEGLSSGLQGGLGALYQQTEQRKQQKQTIQGLQALGVSPEQAAQISTLPKEYVPEALKTLRAQQQNSQFMQALGLDVPGLQGASPLGAEAAPAELQSSLMQQPQMQQQAQGLGSYQRAALQAKLGGGSTEAALRAGQQAEKLEQQRSLAEQKRIDPYMEKLEKKASGSEERLKNLDIQRDLVKSGELDNPYVAALKTKIADFIGLGEEGATLFLKTPSQVFEKIRTQFYSGLKDVFGARPTQFEFGQWKKGFASLLQDDKGKELVIDLMATQDRINVRREEIANKVLDENPNISARKLKNQVNSQMKDVLDQEYGTYRKQLSKSLVDDINSFSNKYKLPPASNYPEGKKAIVRTLRDERGKEREFNLTFENRGGEWVLATDPSRERA